MAAVGRCAILTGERVLMSGPETYHLDHAACCGESESLEECAPPTAASAPKPNCTPAEALAHLLQKPEGCPPPLQWRDVIDRVFEIAEPWSVESQGITHTGFACGQGPPLYLLNGLAGSSAMYALVVWLLRDDFRCILWDYPTPRDIRRAKQRDTSAGANMPAGVRGDVKHLATALIDVANAHGDDQFSVFGSSWGATIGLTAMHAWPKRIVRGVFQTAFRQLPLSHSERWLARLGRLIPTRRWPVEKLPAVGKIFETSHKAWFPPFDASRFEFLRGEILNTPVRTLATRAHQAATFDLAPLLDEIRQPTLLIETEGEGMLSRRSMDELAVLLPTATIELLNNTGQYVFLTHPHRVAKLIKAFLLPDPAAASLSSP